MSYSAEISRSNPTCFLFLVDQSLSMNERFGGGSGMTKAEGVANAVNRLLQTLVYRCAMGASIVDRYYIGVIGYGTTVESGLGGELTGQGLVSVSEIGNKPLRIDERSKKVPDGAGGVIVQNVKFPIWLDPVAENGSLMCEALRLAQQTVGDFVNHFPNCFPPIVINITDGLADDGDPEPLAALLCEVCSEDGHVLLFNVHISEKGEKPIQYPDTTESLPDADAQRLFRMSSKFPPVMRHQARLMDTLLKDGARGYVFNGDLVSVIQLLEIGTRVDTSTR